MGTLVTLRFIVVALETATTGELRNQTADCLAIASLHQNHAACRLSLFGCWQSSGGVEVGL